MVIFKWSAYDVDKLLITNNEFFFKLKYRQENFNLALYYATRYGGFSIDLKIGLKMTELWTKNVCLNKGVCTDDHFTLAHKFPKMQYCKQIDEKSVSKVTPLCEVYRPTYMSFLEGGGGGVSADIFRNFSF